MDVVNRNAGINLKDTYLGIELGSTRIKAVLIDKNHNPIASGSHDWENQLVDGIWTYSLDDVWAGLRGCYAKLKADVLEKHGVILTSVGGMGISGMMHGYLPFDVRGGQLVPFRTWRNTMTGQAAEALTDLFVFNIPQRWSIAHLYQAILNNEPHVADIAHLTTLAGYVHSMLTGERVVGVGEASGMFPIDSGTGQFDTTMMAHFDALMAQNNLPWKLAKILPRVQAAGTSAGTLTAEGAKLLDASGDLQPGIPLCPPEGDAGTGMVATNAVRPRTGNVSAGTSVFAMAVLEKPLSRVYSEIDIVTTPAGDPVAMVHCNNCTGDIDAWVALFGEFAVAAGLQLSKPQLYDLFYNKALEADADGGGLLAYNYISGEHITGLSAGRPLFVRRPDSVFTLANFARTQLFAALGALRTGMDILYTREGVQLDSMSGHGGFFKTKAVGQKMMAAALLTPVTVGESAGEGGPWGMAILAAYSQNRRQATLDAYLQNAVFANAASTTEQPDPKDVDGYSAFFARYTGGLAIERAAVETL